MKSFDTEVVPADWRHADVVPVYKKDNSSTPGNYRAVSLTLPICKVIENILADSMTDYLLSLGLLTDHQHRFLRKRSPSQLLECVNEWCLNIDKVIAVDIDYIDFGKAFDIVSHPKLLHKMQSYGICRKLLRWHK